MRPLLIGLALLCCNSLAHADEAAPLERGTAILEPFALRELDKGPFGLGRMLFHLLVIPLQAFIFMMLSIVYLSLSEDSH